MKLENIINEMNSLVGFSTADVNRLKKESANL